VIAAARESALPSGRRSELALLRFPLQRFEQAEQSGASLVRWQRYGFESPNVSTPSLLPRRVATWPTAIATPSATSAFRRSRVPNCIDGDVVEQKPRDENALRDG